MRRFTKKHNDLTWLFPDIIDEDNNELSEKWFDTYEKKANDLIETIGIGDADSFSKDDLIDSFMKGASIAQQMLIQYYSIKLESLKDFNNIKKSIEDFNERFNNGFYDKKSQ